jgi:hypothetical protein
MWTSYFTEFISSRFELSSCLFGRFYIDFYLESDVEEFEDNPEEYIRKDIEKSGKNYG